MPESILLSPEIALIYIARKSGVRGRLTEGRVERSNVSEIAVFDKHGLPFDYLSGSALKAWCIVDSSGRPPPGWCNTPHMDLS
jgi:hypothetical protein